MQCQFKSATYRRWQFPIPENANEIFKHIEGENDTAAYYVYNNVTKDGIRHLLKHRVVEAYETYFMSKFRPLCSKFVPEDMKINWEHELYGYFQNKKHDTWWLFCVLDADENLLYVMDIST